MRLIDADALKAEFTGEFMERYHYTTVHALIDIAPTIDPKNKGKWNILEGTRARRVCSSCGWDVPEYGKFYSYCPNCGAEMEV